MKHCESQKWEVQQQMSKAERKRKAREAKVKAQEAKATKDAKAKAAVEKAAKVKATKEAKAKKPKGKLDFNRSPGTPQDGVSMKEVERVITQVLVTPRKSDSLSLRKNLHRVNMDPDFFPPKVAAKKLLGKNLIEEMEDGRVRMTESGEELAKVVDHYWSLDPSVRGDLLKKAKDAKRAKKAGKPKKKKKVEPKEEPDEADDEEIDLDEEWGKDEPQSEDEEEESKEPESEDEEDLDFDEIEVEEPEDEEEDAEDLATEED